MRIKLEYAIVKWGQMNRTTINKGKFDSPIEAQLWFDDFIISSVIMPFNPNIFRLSNSRIREFLNDPNFLILMEKFVNIYLDEYYRKLGTDRPKNKLEIVNPNKLFRYCGIGAYSISFDQIVKQAETLILPVYLEGRQSLIYQPPSIPGTAYSLEITGGAKLKKLITLN